MREKINDATVTEWRELEKLVDQFCESISDLSQQVGQLESKVISLKNKRAARLTPALQPSPQEHARAL